MSSSTKWMFNAGVTLLVLNVVCACAQFMYHNWWVGTFNVIVAGICIWGLHNTLETAYMDGQIKTLQETNERLRSLF